MELSKYRLDKKEKACQNQLEKKQACDKFKKPKSFEAIERL